MCPSIVNRPGQSSGSLPGETEVGDTTISTFYNIKDSALRNSGSAPMSLKTPIFDGIIIVV